MDSLEFFRKKIISAPLAGYTSEPFRILLKELGYSITWTEMISVEGLKRRQKKTLNMITLKKEPPVVVPQLFGAEPMSFFEAGRILKDYGFKIVDINAGCPVKKVIKKGAGVKLMETPKKLFDIVKNLKKLDLIVSVKIRLGINKEKENYLEIIQYLIKEGVDIIIIHPRFGEDFFKGIAQWKKIKDAKEKFPESFIIGNGDIQTPENIKDIFELTDCDAVMIGRGLCQNPFLIEQWFEFLKKGSYPKIKFYKKIIFFKKLFYLLCDFYGEELALKLSKKYLIMLTKGEKYSSKIRKKISSFKNSVEIYKELMYWISREGNF